MGEVSALQKWLYSLRLEDDIKSTKLKKFLKNLMKILNHESKSYYEWLDLVLRHQWLIDIHTAPSGSCRGIKQMYFKRRLARSNLKI